ncbi:hypothetical protein MTR67_005283 [Solanum verrucosum]|uniref:Uncharacterized protein n=1 Tax=Solanum verrucosum TaxID=315347 RepID=A0AAF0PW47_SOLVR|nr:hypothetical protein MTR67_005283 [Solanum verrucosum]
MAYPSDHRSSSRGTVRFVLVLVGLFLVIYMVTTPTLRHSKALSSCPPCFCDCEEDPMFSPIGGRTGNRHKTIHPSSIFVQMKCLANSMHQPKGHF